MAYVPQNFQSGDVLYASQLNEMDSQIGRNEASAAKRDFIAKDYDPTATYKKGDMAIYNGTVQVATVDIPVAEAFAPSHWKLTTVDERLKETLATKADVDGQYENLVAGVAEELISAEADADTVPYVYRRIGGDKSVGKYEKLEKIVGGTVAWNQLASVTDGTSTLNDLTIVRDSAKGTVTINGTAKERTIVISPVNGVPVDVDDVILIDGCPATGSRNTYHNIEAYGAFIDIGSGVIGKMTRTTLGVQIIVQKGVECNNVVFRTQAFNLTKMFGSAIANAVYEIERTTAGAGVAWFRKLFPKDYYPYNPGELISVKTTSHDMVGFNAWDEEIEQGYYDVANNGAKVPSNSWIRNKNLIKCVPNTTYYFASDYTGNESFGALIFFDAGGNQIGYKTSQVKNNTFETPSNCYHIGFYSKPAWFDSNICINLSHSGSRNGEYEPYEKRSYPLADVELRGPLAIDADGKLMYSGDEYPPSGQVKRKYGFLLDMGTLNWGGSSEGWSANIPTLSNKAVRTAYMMCSRYPALCNGEAYPTSGEKVAYCGANYVYVHDSSYSSAAEFKSAMSGAMLLYELATPEIERVAPYTSLQEVVDGGTEEFVDTREVAIPVGHVTQYPASLRDKLQSLPSSAYTDGEYVIKQTGSHMELAKPSSIELAQGIFVETESSPIVSISDGADNRSMRSVKVAIEPVQDLRGYDAPWPAGGRVNRFDEVWESGTINGTTGEAVSNPAFSRSVNFIAVLSDTAYYVYGSEITNTSEVFIFAYQDDGTYIDYKKIVSNEEYTTPSNCAKIRLQVRRTIETATNYLYAINYPNTVTTYSPHSNICPITGWTGAKVTRTGKNICDESKLLLASGWTVTDGVYSGVNNALHNAFHRTKGGFPGMAFKPDTQYTVSFKFRSVNEEKLSVVGFVYTDGTYTGFYLKGTAEQLITLTSANGKSISMVELSYGSSDTIYISQMQVEEGTSASAFEPYQGQTYEVTFPADPGTVYGGTLDVVSGKLVVNRKFETLNDKTLLYADGNNVSYRYDYTDRAKYSDSYTGLICSCFPAMDGFQSYVRWRGAVQDRITFIGTTLEKLSTLIDDGVLQISYPLATPIPYTLTTQEIKTLLGTNNIWADAGNTAITYLADTKTYIDRKIAEAVANALNS